MSDNDPTDQNIRLKTLQYHSDSSDCRSRRARIFQLLDKHPSLSPKELCSLMNLDYNLFGKQVTQRKYEWLHHYRVGVGSKGSKPDGQHHVTCRGWVPKSLERRVVDCENRKILSYTGVTDDAVAVGWELSKNRNRVLLWKKDPNLGRIEWWENGKVSVYVRAPINMGRVKQLLFQAFFGTGLICDMRFFDKFTVGFTWSGSHDVWNASQKLPYLVIKGYERSGIKAIKLGDRSHPYSVEIEWATPEWADKVEVALAQNAKSFDQFTAFMKEFSSPRKLNPADKSVV